MGDASETLKGEIAAARMERVATCPKCGETWFEVIVTPDGGKISHFRCKCGNEILAWEPN